MSGENITRIPPAVSRRRWLELMMASGVTFGSAELFELLAGPQRAETPGLAVGPFYPVLKPLDKDADLTRIAGRKGRASGQVIDVSGRILNRNGEPVRNARIELWQANTHGRYSHEADPNRSAPLDPNFQGFGVQTTDQEGRYRFKTIKPGAYPGWGGSRMRAPHLHFDIQARQERKATQMFFPNEPLNAQDRLFIDIPRDRDSLVASVAAAGASGELLVTWDVILA